MKEPSPLLYNAAMIWMIFLVSLALLLWGADRFVISASAIAWHCGMPPLLVGTVLVGFATAFPEMLVSLLAALKHHASLSLGNALGSYMANIGMVLGGTALLVPLKVNPQLLRREMPALTGALIITYLLLSDRYLGRLDGAILMSLLVAMLIALIIHLRHRQDNPRDILVKETKNNPPPKLSLRQAGIWLVIGLAILTFSSQSLIYSATTIAKSLGISDLVIGLTAVAIGTSLPELAASVVAAWRNEPDIAIGNVIGSNIFGLLGVAALPGLISPSIIDANILTRDFGMMTLITAALWLTTLPFVRKKRSTHLTRTGGSLLLIIYLGYMALFIPQG